MRTLPRGIVLSIALFLGLMTAVAVYVFLSAQATQAGTKVRVVAAKRFIPSGTIIGPDMLELQVFSRTQLPPAPAISTELVVGKVTSIPIKAGEPVSLTAVVPKHRLSHLIPPSMRAVTVAVDPVIGVGGFLKPGDHVDVLATFNENDGTATRTVLQDVQLLACGGEVQDDANPQDQGGNRPTAEKNSSATLLVLPPEAERLILAENRGKLRLTLRRADDSSIAATKGVTGRDIIGAIPATDPSKNGAYGYNPPPRPYAMAPAPGMAASANPGAMYPWQYNNAPLVKSPRVQPANAGARTSVRTPKSGRTIQFVRGTQVEDVMVPE